MTTGWRSGIGETIRRGILAGTAGGLAEIIWLSLYASITGGDAAILARGVTTAAGVTALLPQAPVALGIGVHMAIAVSLGVVLAGLWQTLMQGGLRRSNRYGAMLATLAAIWAMNFLVVLPLVSPSFVHLVPFAVSLTSKLLFGLAAAETLRRCATAQAPAFEHA